MAAASWMLRNPNIRGSRFHRSKHVNHEDDIKFDINKDPRQNVQDILFAICKNSDISEGKRLNFLNAFVKVTLHIEGNFESIGFKMDDVLMCLRIALLHESTQIRSGGLRAIRHILRNENDIIQLNKLLIPFLVARSLDLVLKNDVERIEAMKLIRKILLLSPSNLHVSLARSLIALANNVVDDKDRMLRICLATLCELGVINTNIFIHVGGVAAITRNLLECQTPKIAESLCGVLLLLLDRPLTRNQANIDLHAIAAPYCDFHYRHNLKDKDKYVDERELRFNCSRLALLSILRSWPGILHFCSPSNKCGLKAIVEVLYLNQLEVRKAVLDLLYELLGLPQPEWTDELSVALNAVDPAELQTNWRLNDGFVAAEGRSVLPHLSKTTPTINDMHLAFLLYSFLECGLLGAIVEVISTSDTFISVRATVLLGELLHLIQLLLPPECCNVSPALPTLLEYTVQDKPQALAAVTGLQQLHVLLKKRPASYSLHLDFILRSGENLKFTNRKQKKPKQKFKNFKTKIQQIISKDGDDVIKETGVLVNKDAYTWNWNLIRIILRGEMVKIDLVDASERIFFKRLIDFYMPSKNRYSHMDLSSTKVHLAYTMTGIELINCLDDLANDESDRLLKELFTDILHHILAITNGKSVHDCLFSPQHMNSTQCQSYFLFIGRLATRETGIELLNKLDTFKRLEYLATTTNNDCYIKLIISSLDYSNPGSCRNLLTAVLKCSVESSRLYATQFLLVLLRAGINDFSDWGVKLLVNQLDDQSKSVYLSALVTLHEACELTDCLHTLIKLNPDLTHLGEKGQLLKIRFLSVISGFELFNKTNSVLNEIQYWDSHFNYRYVKLIEGEISDALTLHQRDEYGKYDKRTSSIRANNTKDVFLLPHLYGQLALHSDGFKMLLVHGSIEKMLQLLEHGLCETDEDIFNLKAALWAIGHLGSCIEGIQLLLINNSITLIINLAQNCLVYSIRATAYYVLGLIASTSIGADELFKLGWFCTRHNRHDTWPIIEEEKWNERPIETKINFCLPEQMPHEEMIFDFGSTEHESSTDDDTTTSDSHLVMSESRALGNKKSSTLPVNQNLILNYHKRSLSESKTFEIIKGYDQKLREKNNIQKISNDITTIKRYRNNSTTDSTTSGVSSCESVCAGGGGKVYERQKILSPIPSSCSLSTFKQPKIRRHSESCRRISSGTNPEKSITGSVPYKLSHQDLVGYATLRHLRRSPMFPEESWICDTIDGEMNWDVPSNFNEDFNNITKNSLPNLSSMKRFSISDSCNHKGRCYLGICLPQNINYLFLDENEKFCNYLDKYLTLESTMTDSSIEQGSFEINTQTHPTIKCWQHDINSCLNCVKSPNCDLLQEPENITIKLDILKLVDHFSNPVWTKQVKQSLLQWKQRAPHIFRDLCLYSEISKMISENAYRLIPRRMLHELFLEFDLNKLMNETTILFENICEKNNQICAGNDDTSNVKRLDAIKLTYKENKFPIRKRDQSKVV